MKEIPRIFPNLWRILSDVDTAKSLFFGNGSKEDKKDAGLQADKKGEGQIDERLFSSACHDAVIALSKSNDLTPFFEDGISTRDRAKEAEKMVDLVENVILNKLTPEESHLVVLTIGLRQKSVVEEIEQPDKEEIKDGKTKKIKVAPIKKTTVSNSTGCEIVVRLALTRKKKKIKQKCKLMLTSINYSKSKWDNYDEQAAQVLKQINKGLTKIFPEDEEPEYGFWFNFVPFSFLFRKD